MPRKSPSRRKPYQRAYGRKWYAKNKERFRARRRGRKWRAYHRKWREDHQEYRKARSASYYRRNKKVAKASSKRSYQKNKDSQAVRTRARHKKNPLIRKAQRLKSEYGITLEEFFEMQKKQKNRCAICKEQFDKPPKVDHNHKTGAIRGLLCNCCNLGLGIFKDSRTILKSADQYLEQNNKKRGPKKVE